MTTDQEATYTCESTSRGGTARASATIKRDATPPVLVDVPADITLHATGDSAVAAWETPTATDAHLASPEVRCDRNSGDRFPLGRTTVTCTATDDAGNVGTASFTVAVASLALEFDSPIDAPSAMNSARLDGVVPVRLTLTADGTPVTGDSTVPVYLHATNEVSCWHAEQVDDVELYALESSSTGNLFRWEPERGRWTHDLDTGALGMRAGSCYLAAVFYGGSVEDGTASGGSLAGLFYLHVRD